MQKYLSNMALILAVNHALEHNIDPRGRNQKGSYLYKDPRRQSYTLKESETEEPIVSITLYPNRTPLYITH